MLLLVVVLSACVGEKSGDTAGVDSADTGSGMDAWEPVLPVCDLVAPFVVTDGAIPAFWRLYGPDFIHLASLRTYLDHYVEDRGCPTRTEDTEGNVVYEGSCTSDDYVYEGRWTSSAAVGADGVRYEAEAAEGVDFADAYFIDLEVTADGFVRYQDEGVGTPSSLERDLALELHGYDEGIDGTWYVRSIEERTAGQDYIVSELYVDALPDEGLTGDYCITRDTRPIPECDLEPWGGWVLQGSATAVITFDPEVACDGCANVTIDGEDAGELCGSDYGATYIPD
ncbi:MAG: hypothetical protein Q8P41_20810 [Pseudomonadota bacterium]|nr:hypothetical protein [Pseudomonadota bacterium]